MSSRYKKIYKKRAAPLGYQGNDPFIQRVITLIDAFPASIEQIEARAGISHSVIWRMRCGARPRVDFLMAILEVIGYRLELKENDNELH